MRNSLRPPARAEAADHGGGRAARSRARRARTRSRRPKRRADRAARRARRELDAPRSARSAGRLHRSDRRALQSLHRQPVPTSQAVMFCLMDVSGSMGEREKDLAKRFYMLLHLFLKRRYERVDVVFIRHTHEAQEVDEQEFFYAPQIRRHDRLDRARQDAGDPEGALCDRRLEHLLRRRPPTATPIGRRAALRGAAERRDHAAVASTTPISRSSTSARWKSSRRGAGAKLVARLSHGRRAWRQLRHQAHRQAARHLSRVPRALRKQAREGRRHERDASTRRDGRAASVRRRGMGFRDAATAPTTRSRRSRSTISSSTSIPTRSRSSRPSRCSTPIPRSACR